MTFLAAAAVVPCASHPSCAQVATGTPVAASPISPIAARNDYRRGEYWLCRPGRHDACVVDLTTTVVSPDGKLTLENWTPYPAAPIDCFYVYPTVSTEQTWNSDMVPGPGETNIVRVQFARFGSKCRLYAPMYRQVTRAALRAQLTGRSVAADQRLAYQDVLDAWNDYLEHDNNGRGVVLIGHSQGARMLAQLIRNEIDGKPIQGRLVSALLLGTNLPVPSGKDVGGAYRHIPLCRSPGQTGCVVTYTSFRANTPPPATSPLGTLKTGHSALAGATLPVSDSITLGQANMMTGCTNPAAIGGGPGSLHDYFGSTGDWGPPAPDPLETIPGTWVKPPQTITTPFVSLTGMLTGECVTNERGSYLAITVHGDSAGPRTGDIGGDHLTNNRVGTEWGLHLIDVNLAMGNLLDLVEEQGKAFLARNGQK